MAMEEYGSIDPILRFGRCFQLGFGLDAKDRRCFRSRVFPIDSGKNRNCWESGLVLSREAGLASPIDLCLSAMVRGRGECRCMASLADSPVSHRRCCELFPGGDGYGVC